MESPGAKLKKIRLEKGISFEEAQKKTKIHHGVLKAIEEESLVSIDPVYVKGFLKIYCKFLGVNPAGFIPSYKEPSGSPELKRDPPSFAQSASFFQGLAHLWLDASKIRIAAKFAVISVIAVICFVFLIKIPKFFSFFRSRASFKDAGFSSLPPASAIQKNEAKKDALPTVIRLGIKAKDNCMVKVKVDGRVLMDRMFRKGMSDSWEAKEKLELSLSNAGAVELEINGKLISSLGRKGQAIKNMLFTRDGWNIPR